MKQLRIALRGTILLAGACSGNSDIQTVASPPPTPAEELDAAVRSAARALIDVPGASATESRYGDNGSLTTTR